MASASDLAMELCYESEQGDIAAMCRLIQEGADVNYLASQMQAGVQWSATPLIQSALRGHVDAVRVLISRKADVNKPNQRGNTPLHVAAQCDHVPVIELLISKGARVDAKNNIGLTPLHTAAGKGHKASAICLLDHGADPNANFDCTPLYFAAQENRLAVVDLLLLRGADPNLINFKSNDRKGQASLHIAAHDGNVKIAERLVEGGANVNLMNKVGTSPLLLAAQEGHLAVVKFLVKNGANIHQASILGVTPLHSALSNNRKEVVDYLIKKGADFDDEGNSVAKVCKCCGATDVPLMVCSGCKLVCYCSPECQKKDWKEGGEKRHKIQCPRIKEQRELYKEIKKEEAKSEMQQIDEKVKREVRENAANLLIKMPSCLLSWICEDLICEDLFEEDDALTEQQQDKMIDIIEDYSLMEEGKEEKATKKSVIQRLLKVIIEEKKPKANVLPILEKIARIIVASIKTFKGEGGKAPGQGPLVETGWDKAMQKKEVETFQMALLKMAEDIGLIFDAKREIDGPGPSSKS